MEQLPNDARLEPETFQTVLDCVSDAVFTVSRHFVITSFNRAAERATGFSRGEAIGQHCYDVMRSHACRNVNHCPLAQSLREGHAQSQRELTILNRRNEAAVVRICARPLRNAAGEIVGAVEAFRTTSDGDGDREPTTLIHATETPDGRTLPILEASERRAIESVLRRHNWNRSTASEELGISRTTLWRKMRKLGISAHPPQGFKPSSSDALHTTP